MPVPRAPRSLVLALLVATAGLAVATSVPDPMSSSHDHGDRGLHQHVWGPLAHVGHVDPPRLAPSDALLAALAPDRSVELGFEPLDAGGAYFGEVDVRGRYAYLAQLAPPAGVHVIDVLAPSAPTQVGQWNVPSGNGGITDVKVSLDGRYVYAAYQGPAFDLNNGVFVLDVQVPTSPVVVSHLRIPIAGVHMLYVAEVNGLEYVLMPTSAT